MTHEHTPEEIMDQEYIDILRNAGRNVLDIRDKCGPNEATFDFKHGYAISNRADTVTLRANGKNAVNWHRFVKTAISEGAALAQAVVDLSDDLTKKNEALVGIPTAALTPGIVGELVEALKDTKLTLSSIWDRHRANSIHNNEVASECTEGMGRIHDLLRKLGVSDE